MSDEEKVAIATAAVLAEWPTLSAAWGCVDCEGLFKTPTEDSECPHCRSRSVFDVVKALNAKSQTEAQEEHA